MNIQRPNKDLIEIFGYEPDDARDECRMLWRLGACQFTGRQCTKHNHDKTIIYGVCAVTTPYGDCIICPNRLYAEDLLTLRTVSKDAFGMTPFMTFPEYIKQASHADTVVVALGMHSGHEIGGKAFSMDWVLARVEKNRLEAYTGVEVQSLDITGNYRDTWHAYRNIDKSSEIPKSCHGLNWANVHKRLIPQIIRKSLLYSRSPYVKTGLYFIVPDVVYRKFEEIIGPDIPLQKKQASDVITVLTWSLGAKSRNGKPRKLVQRRKLRFRIDDFSERFISGPNLPGHEALDNSIKQALDVK